MPAPRLLPCPFCRSRDVEVSTNTSVMYAKVECNACGAKGPPSRPTCGPEWRETVALVASALWNDAVCRYAGWVKE